MSETFEKVWTLYRAAGQRRRLELERPRGEAAFDGDVRVGEIRIFADATRPFVALIVEDRGNEGWLIVPVSPFAVPASERELMVGSRVFQLWNAITASRTFTDRSWLVDTVNVLDLEEIRLKIAAAHPGRVEGSGCVGEYERAFLVSAPWGAMLAGSIGALLVGLGVIAFFAANVLSVGRLPRVALASVPILACGVAALTGAVRRVRSAFFWEPIAILWTLSLGAGVATVSQVYQLTEMTDTLWADFFVLSLPILLTTRSVVLSVSLPLACAVLSPGFGPTTNGRLALAAFAVAVPPYVAFLRNRPPRAALLTAQVASAFTLAVGLPIVGCLLVPFAHPGVREAVSMLVCLGLIVAGRSRLLPTWAVVGQVMAVFYALSTCWFGAGFFSGMEVNYALWGTDLALALGLIFSGMRKLRVFTFDLGAFLLLNLIVARFFSPSWSFLAKAGVLSGCGVLLAGVTVALLMWKKRRAA